METETTMMGFTAKLAQEFIENRRPIDDCQPHPENVRKHKIDMIARSLEAHGQRYPVIVQASTGYICKGNGTWEAAKLLGWTELLQSWQELTDEQALAYLYADNRASDLSSYDRKKLRAGLEKLMQGPGLFDTLWGQEDFLDLTEELDGATVLDPTDSEASFATDDGEGIKHERASLPGQKMREVPLIFEPADHAAFLENVRILTKAFGSAGSIATIFEAVRRQAEMETIGQTATGTALGDDATYAIKRAVVTEIRDYYLALGADKTYTGTQIAARLEQAVPYQQPSVAPVAEGQAELFTDASYDDDPIVDTLFVASPPVVADIPKDPAYSAEQAEALRRYRAQR